MFTGWGRSRKRGYRACPSESWWVWTRSLKILNPAALLCATDDRLFIITEDCGIDSSEERKMMESSWEMHDYANEMQKAVMSGSLQHQQTRSANITNGRERKLKRERESCRYHSELLVRRHCEDRWVRHRGVLDGQSGRLDRPERLKTPNRKRKYTHRGRKWI